MAKTPNQSASPFDDDGDDRTARGASQAAAQDGRVQRDAATEERGDRGIAEDTARSENALSDAEFNELLDAGFDDNRLPNVPRIPGYHCCWLTTQSPYDSISKRQRLGYTPVRYSEVPEMAMLEVGVQQADGPVTCNEMVLHKIDERRFQALMAHYHHKLPLRDEQGTLEKIHQGNDRAGRDSSGKELAHVEGDGVDTMERSVKQMAGVSAPRFAGG